MKLKKHFFGSAILATLLLSGCNVLPTENETDTDTETTTLSDTNAQTPSTLDTTTPQGDELQHPVVQPAPSDIAILSQSLNATAKNVKIALSKIENSTKQTQSTNSGIAVSDIIYAYFGDDLNDAEGNTFKEGAARAYFNSLVESGEIVLDADEERDLAQMSAADFDAAFTEGFAEIATGTANKQTNGFLSKVRDKVKSAAKKVVKETTRVVEDAVDVAKGAANIAKDSVELGVEIAKNGIETGVEVAKDAGGAFDDLVHGDLSGVKDRVEAIGDDITDGVKDSIIDVAESDLMAPVVDEVFKVALNSGKVTKAMLDMAINSQTITQVMIDALEHNWGLTTKMIPMLESDPEFGYKFAQLAKQWDIMSAYFFEAVDAPMYSALTKAMLLHDGTALVMSELMDKRAVEYFVIPAVDYVPAAPGQAGDKERFVSLLMDTGAISDVATDSTTRGDGNEIANEAFFYTLFKSPESTANFVKAMEKVKANNAHTVKTLMDHIFLGKRASAQGEITDSEQSIYNIYAIAKAMSEGVGIEGFDTYKDSFVGFAGLISIDRFIPYGKSFIGAGSHYMDEHDLSVSEFIAFAKEAIFDTDNAVVPKDAELSDETTASKRLHAEDGTEVESTWYDDLWETITSSFNGISEWWDAQTEDFDAYITELTDGITTAIGDTVDGLSEDARVYLEGEIRTLIGDADYVLPPFAELSIDYVTGEATRRFDDYITVRGIDGAIADLSDSEFVQEYVYGTALEFAQGSEYWEYMPNWIAGMDWLKLPDTYEDYQLEFNADNIAVYIISKNDSLEAMREILGKPNLIQVDNLEDSPISNESDEFYIYKLVLFNGEDINFKALAEAGVEAGDYVSNIVVDNSEATSEPETTTTTEATN